MLTAVGVTTGLVICLIATAAGLAALLVASETLFLALRLAGGAYLVWFGLRAWRDAVRRNLRSDHHLAEPAPGSPRLSPAPQVPTSLRRRLAVPGGAPG